MKKKIIFAIATGFFAVATVFNMNVLQANSAGDVSLDAIAVMAQAQNENGGGASCCSNGYKSWFDTSNIPTQRKQSFYDCWCKPKQGYDPSSCNC
jgi:hypothetical protein